jgi:hypothetical protein
MLTQSLFHSHQAMFPSRRVRLINVVKIEERIIAKRAHVDYRPGTSQVALVHFAKRASYYPKPWILMQSGFRCLKCTYCTTQSRVTKPFLRRVSRALMLV